MNARPGAERALSMLMLSPNAGGEQLTLCSQSSAVSLDCPFDNIRVWFGREMQREVWSAHPSKSQGGKIFYFNRTTKQKSWSVPPGLKDPPWYPQQQAPKQRGEADASDNPCAESAADDGGNDSAIGAEPCARTSSSSSEPLGGLNKSGEELRAEAHNCIMEGCSYGYVKANCSDYIWVCRQSGLPHICSMFQCNIFHLAQGRTCPISGNNFTNIGGADCSGSEEGVERRLSELDADERANYGIGVQGAAKKMRARQAYQEALTNFASGSGGQSDKAASESFCYEESNMVSTPCISTSVSNF